MRVSRIVSTCFLKEMPDDKYQKQFTMESECSLMLDSELRKQIREYAKDADLIHMLSDVRYLFCIFFQCFNVLFILFRLTK